MAGVLQDITATKTLTDQLEHHATFDELTSLYKRRTFWKAVEAEYAAFNERANTSHLLFIDLDQFKLVNDTSGHVAGDRLLRIFARVLKDNVHDDDVVGRVFVRALINIAKTMGIKTVAEFVENDAIYEIVKEFSVDYVQGFGLHWPEKLRFYGGQDQDWSQDQVIESKRAG